MLEPEILYPVDDACRRLGIRRSKFYQLVKEKKLEIRKIGTRSVVPASSIARFVDSVTGNVKGATAATVAPWNGK
jgi:excisionase family DNA binding protein